MLAEAPAPRLDVDGMAAHALMRMHTDCSEEWERLVQRPATALTAPRVTTMAEASAGHCLHMSCFPHGLGLRALYK